jgi:hypothetical protein
MIGTARREGDVVECRTLRVEFGARWEWARLRVFVGRHSGHEAVIVVTMLGIKFTFSLYNDV